jgi:hypothetical protein
MAERQMIVKCRQCSHQNIQGSEELTALGKQLDHLALLCNVRLDKLDFRARFFLRKQGE